MSDELFSRPVVCGLDAMETKITSIIDTTCSYWCVQMPSKKVVVFQFFERMALSLLLGIFTEGTLNIHRALLVLLRLKYNVYHSPKRGALEPIMVEEMGHSKLFWTWCLTSVSCNSVNSVLLRLCSNYAQDVTLNRKKGLSKIWYVIHCSQFNGSQCQGHANVSDIDFCTVKCGSLCRMTTRDSPILFYLKTYAFMAMRCQISKFSLLEIYL